MLKVTDLEVAYGGIRAVKGIDLEVAKSELVTLIGANGAGKTTALKALAGLINPARGRVQYDGRETTGMPAHEPWGSVSLVPEVGRIRAAHGRKNPRWRLHPARQARAAYSSAPMRFFPARRAPQAARVNALGRRARMLGSRGRESRPQLLLRLAQQGLAPAHGAEDFRNVKSSQPKA